MMDDRFLHDLVCLREQVAVSLDIAAQGAREYYESWRGPGGPSRRVLGRNAHEIEHLRRRETLYLGEAAALQWILCRLDQLVAEISPGAFAEDHLLREQVPPPADDSSPSSTSYQDRPPVIHD